MKTCFFNISPQLYIEELGVLDSRLICNFVDLKHVRISMCGKRIVSRHSSSWSLFRISAVDTCENIEQWLKGSHSRESGSLVHHVLANFQAPVFINPMLFSLLLLTCPIFYCSSTHWLPCAENVVCMFCFWLHVFLLGTQFPLTSQRCLGWFVNCI